MDMIKELYNKLYNDYRSLSSEEVQLLFNDFQSRTTEKIITNNAGKYLIKPTTPDYIFNGFAIIKQTEKILYDFQVLLEENIDISIDDDMEVLLVNCDAILKEKTYKQKEKQPSISDSTSVSEVVVQLEKLQALRQAGAITDDEFAALKKEIFNS